MAKILKAKEAKILSLEGVTGNLDNLMEDILRISSIGCFTSYNRTLSPAQVIRLKDLGYTLIMRSEGINQYDISWV